MSLSECRFWKTPISSCRSRDYGGSSNCCWWVLIARMRRLIRCLLESGGSQPDPPKIGCDASRGTGNTLSPFWDVYFGTFINNIRFLMSVVIYIFSWTSVGSSKGRWRVDQRGYWTQTEQVMNLFTYWHSSSSSIVYSNYDLPSFRDNVTAILVTFKRTTKLVTATGRFTSSV